MAELLIKAVNATHSDPEQDRRGCYKRGMPVVVMPDGHQWGSAEGLPSFVVLKLPGVSVDRVKEYLDRQTQGVDAEGRPLAFRRRLWRFRFEDMPLAARNKLAQDGELTIAVGGYAGPADYTWAQVKTFLRNEATGLDETRDP